MTALVRICILSLLLPSSLAANYDVAWVRALQSTGADDCRSVDAKNGFVYVSGAFFETMTVGDITLTSKGNADVFVAKYTAAGELVWIRAAGGNGADYSYGTAVDNDGNVIITGRRGGHIDFGGTTLTKGNVFIVKYNSSGEVLWARSAGGENQGSGRAIAVDASNNIYVTGEYSLTGTFEHVTLNSRGYTDIFIARYSKDGALHWAASAGGSDTDIGFGIAVSNNALYVTGDAYDGATFSGTKIVGSGSTEIFLAKYAAASGGLEWVRVAGGNGRDLGQDITVDGEAVYLTGYFVGAATFGNKTATATGSEDGFIASYSSAGDVNWVTQIGGSGAGYATGVSVFNSQLYVGGSFSLSGAFGDTVLTSNDVHDGFLARYDTDGSFVDAVQVGKGTGNTIIFDMVVDNATGVIAFAGRNEGAVSIADTTIYNIGATDIFVGGLLQMPTSTPDVAAMPAVTFRQSGLSLEVSYTCDRAMPVQIAVVDAFGRTVSRHGYGMQSPGSYVQVLDVSGTASGFYFARVAIGGIAITHPFVIIQ